MTEMMRLGFLHFFIQCRPFLLVVYQFTFGIISELHYIKKLTKVKNILRKKDLKNDYIHK